MKKGYCTHIEKETLDNKNFRKVLYTSEHMQLVLMKLLPGEEIGLETHHENDQFFRFESGKGKVCINESEYIVTGGDAVIIPAGSLHNVINTSFDEPLTMYTIYAVPHHKDGTIHPTKEAAANSEEEWGGETTES